MWITSEGQVIFLNAFDEFKSKSTTCQGIISMLVLLYYNSLQVGKSACSPLYAHSVPCSKIKEGVCNHQTHFPWAWYLIWWFVTPGMWYSWHLLMSFSKTNCNSVEHEAFSKRFCNKIFTIHPISNYSQTFEWWCWKASICTGVAYSLQKTYILRVFQSGIVW